MKWTVLELTINRDNIEPVTGVLYNLGIETFEIVDEHITKEELGHMYAGFVDDALDMDSDEIIIKCFFSEQDNFEEMNVVIQDAFKVAAIESQYAVSFSEEEDWANNWKAFFKPFKIGDKLVIKPIWESYEAEAGDVIIEIEPGMAFGSGTHETTSLSTKAIEKYLKVDTKVLDVGCGSGILSIIAAKLGATSVLGIDIDVSAVTVAKENVVSNELEDKITIVHGDLIDQVKDRYEIVVANILAEVIIEVASDIPKVMTEDGIFIASGIINDKQMDVMRTLEDEGFEIIEIMEDGEWITIVSRHNL